MLWISSGMVAYSHLVRADSLMPRTLVEGPPAPHHSPARGGTLLGAVILGRVSPDPSAVRLHVVTGKGGTGKTTVAAALALALAADGGHVLLVETEAGRASRSCSTPRRCPTRSAGWPWPAVAAR